MPDIFWNKVVELTQLPKLIRVEVTTVESHLPQADGTLVKDPATSPVTTHCEVWSVKALVSDDWHADLQEKEFFFSSKAAALKIGVGYKYAC